MAGGTTNSADSFTQSKRQTYEGFTKFTFWAALHVVVLLALMAIFLL